MKILTVKDLILVLEKQSQDLPVKYHRGQGICSSIKDCRLVLSESTNSDNEIFDAEPLFVCLY
jgi:hypothetical protein